MCLATPFASYKQRREDEAVERRHQAVPSIATSSCQWLLRLSLIPTRRLTSFGPTGSVLCSSSLLARNASVNHRTRKAQSHSCIGFPPIPLDYHLFSRVDLSLQTYRSRLVIVNLLARNKSVNRPGRVSQNRQNLTETPTFKPRGHGAPVRLSYAPASGAVEPPRSAPASRVVAPHQVPVDAKVELESSKPLRHLAEPKMEEDKPPHDSRRSVLARRCKAAQTEAVGRLASKQRVVVCLGRRVDRPVPANLRRWLAFR